MGLLPIVLGYNDKDVNSAIVQQLEKELLFFSIRIRISVIRNFV